MAPDPEAVRKRVQDALGDAEVRVGDLTGTGDHLEIVVESGRFAGKPLLDQHRMVMDALKERLRDDLHAVKIRTVVPGRGAPGATAAGRRA